MEQIIRDVIVFVCLAADIFLMFMLKKAFNEINKLRNNTFDWTSHMASSISELTKMIDEKPELDEAYVEERTKEMMAKAADKTMTQWMDNIVNYNPYGGK